MSIITGQLDLLILLTQAMLKIVIKKDQHNNKHEHKYELRELLTRDRFPTKTKAIMHLKTMRKSRTNRSMAGTIQWAGLHLLMMKNRMKSKRRIFQI